MSKRRYCRSAWLHEDVIGWSWITYSRLGAKLCGCTDDYGSWAQDKRKKCPLRLHEAFRKKELLWSCHPLSELEWIGGKLLTAIVFYRSIFIKRCSECRIPQEGRWRSLVRRQEVIDFTRVQTAREGPISANCSWILSDSWSKSFPAFCPPLVGPLLRSFDILDKAIGAAFLWMLRVLLQSMKSTVTRMSYPWNKMANIEEGFVSDSRQRDLLVIDLWRWSSELLKRATIAVAHHSDGKLPASNFSIAEKASP